MSSPQIILITGANQGLGYETALQISKLPGYHILLGARDPVKGAAAVERLALQGGLSEVSLLIINVDSDESIYAAKMEVEQRFGKLDVLINNAAIHLDFVPGFSSRKLLQDTFETNVYGVAVTTAAFLPLLEKTPLPRIVNVSSTVGSLERMSMTVPAHCRLQAYNSGKSAVNAFTVYFAQMLRDKHFRIISLDPGHNNTSLNGHDVTGQDPSIGAAGIVRVAVAGPDSGFNTGDFRDQHGRIVPW